MGLTSISTAGPEPNPKIGALIVVIIIVLGLIGYFYFVYKSN